MGFLSSKRFSLFCVVFNSAFAINAFASGSTGFGLLCTAFACVCLYNYTRAV